MEPAEVSFAPKQTTFFPLERILVQLLGTLNNINLIVNLSDSRNPNLHSQPRFQQSLLKKTSPMRLLHNAMNVLWLRSERSSRPSWNSHTAHDHVPIAVLIANRVERIHPTQCHRLQVHRPLSRTSMRWEIGARLIFTRAQVLTRRSEGSSNSSRAIETPVSPNDSWEKKSLDMLEFVEQ